MNCIKFKHVQLYFTHKKAMGMVCGRWVSSRAAVIFFTYPLRPPVVPGLASGLFPPTFSPTLPFAL